jgi:Coenzyme PQQ synthesis protein D (PqqD)
MTASPTSPASHVTAVPAVRLGLRIRNLGGVLHLGEPEAILELSEAAGFIFRSIDGRRSTGEIAALVARCYGIEDQEAAADTAELLDTLVECRAVVFV